MNIAYTQYDSKGFENRRANVARIKSLMAAYDRDDTEFLLEFLAKEDAHSQSKGSQGGATDPGRKDLDGEASPESQTDNESSWAFLSKKTALVGGAIILAIAVLIWKQYYNDKKTEAKNK